MTVASVYQFTSHLMLLNCLTGQKMWAKTFTKELVKPAIYLIHTKYFTAFITVHLFTHCFFHIVINAHSILISGFHFHSLIPERYFWGNTLVLTIGDRGVSRLVSVLLSSASLSLSLPLSLTKQICRFMPLCSLQERTDRHMVTLRIKIRVTKVR